LRRFFKSVGGKIIQSGRGSVTFFRGSPKISRKVFNPETLLLPKRFSNADSSY
jgi:hypothetical protein